MKFLSAVAMAVMLMVVHAPAVSAQEPEPEKEKQKQHEDEKKKKKQPEEKERPQPKPDDRAKPEPKPDKERPKPDTRASQENNSQHGKSANARRIPDDRYRASFGSEHHFRVARGSDRRFEFGGYSFEYVDAWPSDWSHDDEVYIVLEDDQYYLVDLAHPGIRLHIIIVG